LKLKIKKNIILDDLKIRGRWNLFRHIIGAYRI